MLTNNPLVAMVTPQAAVPPIFVNAALKYDSLGRLIVAVDGVVKWVANGLPLDLDGNLCVTIA